MVEGTKIERRWKRTGLTQNGNGEDKMKMETGGGGGGKNAKKPGQKEREKCTN
jgi:hypothetical protein